MATPTLKFITPTVPEADLPLKPEPVEIYGIEGGDTSALEQAIQNLTQRVEALELAAAG